MAEEQPPEDYSIYFKASNLEAEMQPISATIDTMLLRMEEFENILERVKEESSVAVQQNIPKIAAMKPECDELCDRLDALERFVTMVSKNLDAVERQVQIAEEELDIPDKTINVLLKSLNIFGKPKQTERQTNRNASGMYEPVRVFKTEEYFGSAKESASGCSSKVENSEEAKK
ncbi:biogenesis of lysosome-related organelles complex 1 subunit 4 [Armigeres subalbatus]|uniref:biogenesis of lysosome-related organelles complex 1 subunit 4 n=1 Tax=Armigeres subalbatus TaxID=124917 RepID=UPI002ED12B7A